MSNKINKYNIKVPEEISVIFCKKTKTLIFTGPLKKKSMKLELKIWIDESKKIISVSPLPFFQISNTKKKKINTVRNTMVAQIKQILVESMILIHKNLKINGVGYRAFFTETFDQKLLTFKLGYSHYIYIKIPESLKVSCFTKTKLCVFGNSYNNVSHFSSLIRMNKMPEPYKGKGVSYSDEIVELKEGKKI